MNSFDIILHPTDFSEDSDRAFALACSVARDQFAAVVVVHVLPPEYAPASESTCDPRVSESPMIQHCYENFCRMKSLASGIPVSFRLVYGYSVGAILNVAHEERADLIVIASHQHTHFHMQLHGSVTEGLLRQTHCPVMVLRYPEHRIAETMPKWTMRSEPSPSP